MAIEFSCTCGKSYKVHDELAGRSAKCGHCGASLIIPRPPAPQSQSDGPADVYALADADVPEPHWTINPLATAGPHNAAIRSNHITINGQTFASVEQMPPEIRREYESAMQTFAKTSGGPAGVPSSITVNGRTFASVEDMPPQIRREYEPAKQMLAGNRVGLPRISKHIIVNEQKFASVEEMPPELRRKYESVMQKLAKNSGGSATSDGAHGDFKTVERLSTREILVSGKEYHDGKDLPPEVRAALRDAGLEGSTNLQSPPIVSKPGAEHWKHPSLVALLIADLVPVFAVVFLHWKVFPIVLLFWADSVFIQCSGFVKLLFAKWDLQTNSSSPIAGISVFCVIFLGRNLFFLFMLIDLFGDSQAHSALHQLNTVAGFFAGIIGIAIDAAQRDHLIWAIVAAAVSRGLSLAGYFGKGEYLRSDPGAIIGGLFLRDLLTFTALVAAMLVVEKLDSQVVLLLMLLGFRLTLDLLGYTAERSALWESAKENLISKLAQANAANYARSAEQPRWLRVISAALAVVFVCLAVRGFTRRAPQAGLPTALPNQRAAQAQRQLSGRTIGTSKRKEIAADLIQFAGQKYQIIFPPGDSEAAEYGRSIGQALAESGWISSEPAAAYRDLPTETIPPDGGVVMLLNPSVAGRGMDALPVPIRNFRRHLPGSFAQANIGIPRDTLCIYVPTLPIQDKIQHSTTIK